MEFEVDVQVHHYDNTPTNADIPALLNNKGMCYPKKTSINFFLPEMICLFTFFSSL